MHIIGKKTFVIEISLPKKQSAKVVDGITVKDQELVYEYMWFSGVGLDPQTGSMPMNIWTPYPEQAIRYKDRDEAQLVNNLILPESGGKVLEWDECNKAEGRTVIIPVSGAIATAISKPGIDGTGRKN